MLGLELCIWRPTSRCPRARQLSEEADELVVLPADLPDLPGLVLAKLFKVLHRTDIAIAPERSGNGCAAIGGRRRWPTGSTEDAFDLDHNPVTQLSAIALRRSRWALAPTWHRLRTPTDVSRLDPGLEGWEETRALLATQSRQNPVERQVNRPDSRHRAARAQSGSKPVPVALGGPAAFTNQQVMYGRRAECPDDVPGVID